jgi:hypothetical protein
VTVLPESARVILRPFIPASELRIAAILGRTLALTDSEVSTHLQQVMADFDGRHLDIESKLLQHFELVRPHLFTQRPLSRDLMLFIGAMFSASTRSSPRRSSTRRWFPIPTRPARHPGSSGSS